MGLHFSKTFLSGLICRGWGILFREYSNKLDKSEKKLRGCETILISKFHFVCLTLSKIVLLQ